MKEFFITHRDRLMPLCENFYNAVHQPAEEQGSAASKAGFGRMEKEVATELYDEAKRYADGLAALLKGSSSSAEATPLAPPATVGPLPTGATAHRSTPRPLLTAAAAATAAMIGCVGAVIAAEHYLILAHPLAFSILFYGAPAVGLAMGLAAGCLLNCDLSRFSKGSGDWLRSVPSRREAVA